MLSPKTSRLAQSSSGVPKRLSGCSGTPIVSARMRLFEPFAA